MKQNINNKRSISNGINPYSCRNNKPSIFASHKYIYYS